MWVTGLPQNTRIIIEGQDFVSVGMKADVSESYDADRLDTKQVAGDSAISQ